jgi:hypothetical protein
LLAHGRWFSPGTPASSTTKTGRHDIAEILLKVASNTKKSINQSIPLSELAHTSSSDMYSFNLWQKKFISTMRNAPCFFL